MGWIWYSSGTTMWDPCWTSQISFENAYIPGTYMWNPIMQASCRKHELLWPFFDIHIICATRWSLLHGTVTALCFLLRKPLHFLPVALTLLCYWLTRSVCFSTGKKANPSAREACINQNEILMFHLVVALQPIARQIPEFTMKNGWEAETYRIEK